MVARLFKSNLAHRKRVQGCDSGHCLDQTDEFGKVWLVLFGCWSLPTVLSTVLL